MSQQQHIPVLLSPLRAALGRLYSLPGHERFHGGAAAISDDAAVHTFLVDVQSRNVRRKRQSRMQSLLDGGGDTNSNINSADPNASPSSAAAQDAGDDDRGSIWLACLCLLTLPDAHDAERLFAAQTMLGRLRRARLSEAVDIEVEDLAITSRGVTYDVMDKYAGWASSFHPLLHRAADRCRQQQQQQQHATADHCISLEEEERYKGQMTVFLLATVLCLASASARDGNEVMAGSSPLLSTLGSALSISALRLRYPPPAPGSRPKSGSFPHTAMDGNASNAAALADPNIPPLVDIVAQSVTVSADEAESLLGSKRHASHRAICAAIASLPDSILGVPGGARSRISVDPRSIRAASAELRSGEEGFGLMARALESRAPPVAEGNEAVVHAPIIEACQSWASYLTLPVEFIEHTIPLAARYIKTTDDGNGLGITRNLSFAYIIAVFDAASHSVEELLKANLGLMGGSVPQLNRKRQSSKSKKRAAERLQDAIQSDRGKDGEESIVVEAERELLQRLCGSCRAAILSVDELKLAVLKELSSPDGGENSGGEGPIGCLAACASSCLPFLLSGDASQLPPSDSLLLFQSISELLLRISSSSSPTVRALSYGPILAIHSGLVKTWSSACATRHETLRQSELHQAAIDVVYRCTMVLATECKYPPGYFSDLTDNNDEELEIERNDVRDIIRTVSGSDDTSPNGASLLILENILRACADACAVGDALLPPETAVHTFSSLAKPLNKVASILSSNQTNTVYKYLLIGALRTLGDISETTIRAFQANTSRNVIFPVSRLICLASAAFAPSMRYVAAVSGPVDDALKQAFLRALRGIVQAMAISLSTIPELAANSTLDSTQYDIRGAMRGPGGEDHVGCIALFRLAHESTELCNLMTITYDGEEASPKLLLDLCALHEQLKQDELARGPEVDYGRGVTPKTRRILLQTISRIGVVAIEGTTSSGTTSGHTEVVSAKLQELFQAPLQIILQTSGTCIGDKTDTIFRVCEAVFDLSSFSPRLVSSLFSSREHQDNPDYRKAVETIVELVVSGYQLASVPGDTPDNTCIQWGRLRGALFSLFRVCMTLCLSPLALEAVAALNQAECAAITTQCKRGPDSPSIMFNGDVIGEETLPAGAFVEIIHESIANIIKKRDQSALSDQEAKRHTDDCVLALSKSRDVLRVFMLPYPEATGHDDARPSICEAWFFAVTSAITSYKNSTPISDIFGNAIFTELLGETCLAAVQMLFIRSIEKEVSMSTGMSVDGAQTLATIDFLEAALSLGPEMLSLIYQYTGPHVTLDHSAKTALESAPTPTVHAGGALIGAALYRAASGCWPPWGLEGSPQIYSALFYGACGLDTDLFCQIMEAAAEIRLASSPDAGCGAIRPGMKLAGKYFDQMGPKTKEDLMRQIIKICHQNDASGWRRMKVVLKQACGGKKKASGFNQKPSLTDWDCERL